MAKKNDRRRSQPPHPALSQPSFAVAAVNDPPPSVPTPTLNPNTNVKGKGKAKATDKSCQNVTEYPHPPYPVNTQIVQPTPVRWVYNYDHTDPLNFGFMFPVTPAFSTEVLTPVSYPASDSITPGTPAPNRRASGNTGNLGNFPPPSSNGPPEPSPWDQVHWNSLLEDASPRKHISPYETPQQQQYFPPRTLPHRYSPNSEFAPPISQPVLSDEQIWFLPPHGTSAPQAFQGVPTPDARNWQLDDASDISYSFAGPVSTGPLFTPHVAVNAPPPMKRKRGSETPPGTPTPYLHTLSDRQLFSLCSRCRIHDKLSNYPGLCSACLQTSFNTWPSASGTRNENLESLVLFLMPAKMEEVLLQLPPNMPRSRTWRIIPKRPDQREYDFGTLVFQDRWTLSKQQAESTRLFGEDYAELANIAQMYQLSLPRPNKSLEASCTVLITVCELYKSLIDVSSNGGRSQVALPKLLNNVRTARITIRHAFQSLQALAVSPTSSRDRQDWFPACLSASIMAIAAVIFLDVLIACPSPYKEQIWGAAWHDRIVEMRNGGYGMLVALLKANSMGINPLKLDCWAESAAPNPFINVTPQSYSPEETSPGASQGKKRRKTNSAFESEKARVKSLEMSAERERNILLGLNSPAALQGVLALKAWVVKHQEHLKHGQDMFTKSLYMLAQMSPIAGLWRIFELE